jgi:hypothetical protein
MQLPMRPQTFAGIILSLAAGVVCPGQPTTAPHKPTDATKLDPVVDKILTRLEQREVRDLKADVKWELTYVIEEDEDADRKLGTIWYKQEQPIARFNVHFDRKIVGTTSRKLDEQHLFDGRWYVELQSKTKTVTRREIRRPDDRSNPYKLGEGAFPLPFGQKKADILAEFEVRRVPPRKDDPKNTDHLLLVPRPNTKTGESYTTLDFWIARAGPHAGLPIKIVAGKKDGTGVVNSYITISFSNVQLNTGLSSAVFKIETPPGYEEITEPLKPLATPPAASTAKDEAD